jgi:phosphopantetheine adenylyltransferase
MRNVNGDMDKTITTIFLMPPREIAEVSSSLVKGLIGPEGWKDIIYDYVPQPVYDRIMEKENGGNVR